MSADTITQNIKSKILQDFKERIKQDVEPKIKELNCKQCNSQSYSIVNYSDDDISMIAHLKCTNCGFEGEYTIHLDRDDFDQEMDKVNKGLHDLEDSIADMSRKFNKH